MSKVRVVGDSHSMMFRDRFSDGPKDIGRWVDSQDGRFTVCHLGAIRVETMDELIGATLAGMEEGDAAIITGGEIDIRYKVVARADAHGTPLLDEVKVTVGAFTGMLGHYATVAYPGRLWVLGQSPHPKTDMGREHKPRGTVERRNEAARLFNGVLKEMAPEGVTVVDVFDELLDGNKEYTRPECTWDGVHLTPSAFAIVLAALGRAGVPLEAHGTIEGEEAGGEE
jgi:lysophospholipase L1-like esterase